MKRHAQLCRTGTDQSESETTATEHNDHFYAQIPVDVWYAQIMRRLDVLSIHRFAAASLHFIERCSETGALRPISAINACVRELCSVMQRYRQRYHSGQHHLEHLCVNNDLVLRFPQLVMLELDDDVCCITDEALSQLRHLRLLNLSEDSRVTDASVQHLVRLRILLVGPHPHLSDASISRLTKLGKLDLSWNLGLVSDAGLSPLQARLMVLDLSHNRAITDQALSLLTNLTELNLSNNPRISDCGLSPLTALQTLHLSANGRITDYALSALTGLTDLKLSGSPVTDRGLGALTGLRCLRLYNRVPGISGASLRRLTRLEFLSVAHMDTLSDDDMAHLAAETMQMLDLGPNTRITDRSVRRLTGLTSLALRANDVITDAALQPLTDLTHLNLVRNKRITVEGITHLRKLRRLLYHRSEPLSEVHHTALWQLWPGLTVDAFRTTSV